MDAPGKLIYKSRFPYYMIVIAPIMMIAIFTSIALFGNDKGKEAFSGFLVIGPLIIYFMVLIHYSIVSVYSDHIEIYYPLRPFNRKYNKVNLDIKRIIFDRVQYRGSPLRFFIETANGREYFSHSFGDKESERITKVINDLGIESYGIPDKSF